MDFKDDDTIEWRAPFHPDTKLPWLDAETDTGPAVLQLLKDGITKWKDRRVALAFQNLTPKEVCAAFERALNRPCHYTHDLHIEIKVPIPSNYREQLAGIETLFGRYNAPYFPGPDFEYPSESETSRRDSGARNGERPRVSGDRSRDGQGQAQGTGPRSASTSTLRPKKLTSEARRLWPGFRRMEDYAREAFPIEEEANGKTWMKDKSVST